VTTSPLERLRERLAEVHDLTKAATLLVWDQRVMMPPRGAEARAEALKEDARAYKVSKAVYGNTERAKRTARVDRPE